MGNLSIGENVVAKVKAGKAKQVAPKGSIVSTKEIVDFCSKTKTKEQGILDGLNNLTFECYSGPLKNLLAKIKKECKSLVLVKDNVYKAVKKDGETIFIKIIPTEIPDFKGGTMKGYTIRRTSDPNAELDPNL